MGHFQKSWWLRQWVNDNTVIILQGLTILMITLMIGIVAYDICLLVQATPRCDNTTLGPICEGDAGWGTYMKATRH